MSRKCDICGKGPLVGNNVSHAHNLTKTRWMPNIRKMRIVEKGVTRNAYVCTRCLRSNKVSKAL